MAGTSRCSFNNKGKGNKMLDGFFLIPKAEFLQLATVAGALLADTKKQQINTHNK